MKCSLGSKEGIKDSVEVEFADDLTHQLVETLLTHLTAEQTDSWRTLGPVRFRRWRSEDGNPSRSIAYPGVDHRAEKIVRRKTEQLGKDVPNVIVIDAGSIGASIAEWIASIQRLFQPTKNRRIGAVVLFQSMFSVHLDRGYRLWRVVENPHASRPVPRELIRAFNELDESRKISSHSYR